jgi:hypothetical protein
MRNGDKVLGGKPEAQRPLLRPEHRSQDNIRMGWEDVDWIHLAQDTGCWRALVNMVVDFRSP